MDIDIDMPDFSKMSLGGNIQRHESISELFIIIYSFESPDIVFEDLHKKFIEFYIQEAPYECISTHIDEIMKICKCTVNSYDVSFIINFLSSSYGTEYLQGVYNMNCVYL
jgi:hypothetical protein